jgi:choline transport protein
MAIEPILSSSKLPMHSLYLGEAAPTSHEVMAPGGVSEWNDTNNDVKDMHRLGKKQEFKRNFGFISTLGFVSICM